MLDILDSRIRILEHGHKIAEINCSLVDAFDESCGCGRRSRPILSERYQKQPEELEVSMSVEIFLKFGDIAGGYQDQDHKDWIEVLSFKLGFTPSRQGTPNLGAAAGKVNFQDLTFSLPQSKASPKLMEGCCTGKHFPKVLLDVVPTDESAARTGYLSYQLQDVRITSYQTGGSAGEGGVDSMAITFLKLQEAVEGQVGSTC